MDVYKDTNCKNIYIDIENNVNSLIELANYWSGSMENYILSGIFPFNFGQKLRARFYKKERIENGRI